MMRTRIALFSCLTLAMILLTSCTQSATETGLSEEMIEPGDTVGQMRYEPLDKYEWDNGTEIFCDSDHPTELEGAALAFECDATQGDDLFLNCMGMFDETLDELDSIWEEATFAMTVDGRPVDLPAFGTLDMVAHEAPERIVRVWNVAIENVSTGTHEVVCEGSHEGEQWEYHWVYDVE